MSTLGGGGNKCTICDKTAYPAETITYEKKPYHVECFRCSVCSKKMENASAAAQFEDKLYCRQCFDKEGLAQKQKNVKWEKKESTGTAAPSKFGGGGTPCNICAKTVYTGEAVTFEKMTFHPGCFTCQTTPKNEANPAGCGKKIAKPSDAARFENEDGTIEIYCTMCFQKHGMMRKQTVKKASSKTNSLASRFGGGGTKCTVCTKTVYPAEAVSYEKLQYHKECFTCRGSEADPGCGKKMNGTADAAKFDEEDGTQLLFCRKCFTSKGYNRKQTQTHKSSSSGGSSSAIASKFGGGGTKCTICTKTVYPAELVSYEKESYHSDCFKCSVDGCGIKLTTGNANFHKEKGLFCQKHWNEMGLFRAENA